MMTDKELIKQIDERPNLYFWLGVDAEAVEVTEEEFSDKQEEYRKALDDFMNVRIDND